MGGWGGGQLVVGHLPPKTHAQSQLTRVARPRFRVQWFQSLGCRAVLGQSGSRLNHISMPLSNNLSQKDVEQVCQVKEMFQNIVPVCAAGQFFTAMKVNRMRMQTFADYLPIFLFHELQSKVSNIKDRLAIEFLGWTSYWTWQDRGRRMICPRDLGFAVICRLLAVLSFCHGLKYLNKRYKVSL